MSWYTPKNLFDRVFEGGIIIKGIDGALELGGRPGAVDKLRQLGAPPDRAHGHLGSAALK